MALSEEIALGRRSRIDDLSVGIILGHALGFAVLLGAADFSRVFRAAQAAFLLGQPVPAPQATTRATFLGRGRGRFDGIPGRRRRACGRRSAGWRSETGWSVTHVLGPRRATTNREDEDNGDRCVSHGEVPACEPEATLLKLLRILHLSTQEVSINGPVLNIACVSHFPGDCPLDQGKLGAC